MNPLVEEAGGSGWHAGGKHWPQPLSQQHVRGRRRPRRPARRGLYRFRVTDVTETSVVIGEVEEDVLSVLNAVRARTADSRPGYPVRRFGPISISVTCRLRPAPARSPMTPSSDSPSRGSSATTASLT